jgi:hypothetical protein
MAVIEIPLVSRPQYFHVSLARKTYHCRLQWNVPAGVWMLDFHDIIGTPILTGVPLVTGTDLLDAFDYLGFNGAMLVISTLGPPDNVPGFLDLGTRGHVYFISWEAASAV